MLPSRSSVIYLIFCLQVADLAAITENRGSLIYGLKEEIKGEQTQDSVELHRDLEEERTNDNVELRDRNWLVVAGSVLVTSAVISVLTIIFLKRKRDFRSGYPGGRDACDICCSLCCCCCVLHGLITPS